MERSLERETSTLITAAVAGCLTENEFFSIGAAKKLTVIGQQSESPRWVENDELELSQSEESFLSGQWSAVSSGPSIVWQYATHAAPALFRQTNTITNRARKRILSERLFTS